MAGFCTKCGAPLADGIAFCQQCGAPTGQQAPVQQAPVQQAPVQQAPYQAQAPNQQAQYQGQAPGQNYQQPMGQPEGNKPASSRETMGLLIGIAGIIVGILGSILFGLFLSIPSLAAGIVSVLIGVDIKKTTNNQRGSSVMIVGIIAIVFAVIFTIGCLACTTAAGAYSCYGCVGGSCKASNDIGSFYSSWY